MSNYSNLAAMRLAVLFIFLFSACAVFSDGSKNTFSSSGIDSLLERSRQELWTNIPKAHATALLALDRSRKNKNKTKEIESIFLIAHMDARTNKCRSALQTLDAILNNSDADSLSLARINSARGSCYYYIGMADSAKHYFEKAVNYYQKTNNTKLLYPELNNLARAYLQAGETNNAASNLELAKRGFLQSPDKRQELLLRDTKAEILQAQRLYDKALEKHLENYSAFLRSKNTYGKALSALHAGSSYYMLIEDDSSLKYYRIALAEFTSLGDINGMAFCYSNLSRSLLETGETDSALAYAYSALELIKGGDYKRTEAATLQQLGDIYAELKQNKKAISYLERSLVIAEETGLKSLVMASYKSLSELHESTGAHKKAYDYLLRSYRLKDELQPLAFSKKLAEIEDKHATEQKEAQLKFLEQADRLKTLELNKKEDILRNRNILILGLLALGLLGGVAIYFAGQKRKLRLRLEKEIAIFNTQEQERIRFAKDLHDDMGSELSKISFLSELIIQRTNENPEIKKNAETISETTRVMVENMRDMIWALNPENSTLSNLVARIREYASDYMEDHPLELHINFPDEIDQREISHEGQREILMTIKESLNNIIKHADAGRVEIESVISDAFFEISIKDDGKGISQINGSHGNGLKNMRNRIESLGGKYSLESSPEIGTRINISVPISILAKNRILHM